MRRIWLCACISCHQNSCCLLRWSDTPMTCSHQGSAVRGTEVWCLQVQRHCSRKRGGMGRPEIMTGSTLKDPCLLLCSLLHSLSLPLRQIACLPFQRKVKAVSITLASSYGWRWPCVRPIFCQRVHVTTLIALGLYISRKTPFTRW